MIGVFVATDDIADLFTEECDLKKALAGHPWNNGGMQFSSPGSGTIVILKHRIDTSLLSSEIFTSCTCSKHGHKMDGVFASRDDIVAYFSNSDKLADGLKKHAWSGGSFEMTVVSDSMTFIAHRMVGTAVDESPASAGQLERVVRTVGKGEPS